LNPDIQAQLTALFADRTRHVESLQIRDKRKKLRRFGDLMYPSQRAAVDLFAKQNRIAVVKGRQMGFTTALNAERYCELATATDPLHHGVFAVKQKTSGKLLHMMKGFHDGVPSAFRRSCAFALREGWTVSATFGGSGAKAESFSALTFDSDRGQSLSSAHLSEFAFYRDGMEMLASLSSAVNEGLLVLESTPNHWGDPLHTIVRQAQYGVAEDDHPWKVLFLPWWDFPEYSHQLPPNATGTRFTAEDRAYQQLHGITDAQLYWRHRRIREMGDPGLFRREYPATIDEAYGEVDGAYFSSMQLETYTKIREISPGRYWTRFADVRDGNPVCYGVDIAEGVGLDYSVAYGLERATLQPVGVLASNRLGIRQFAEEVVVRAKRDNARIVFELNNHGHAFKMVLDGLGFFDYEAFKTSMKSKLKLYDCLRSHIDERLVEDIDNLTMTELRQLKRSEKGLAPSHPDGAEFHDDRVIAYALALWGLRHRQLSRPSSSRWVDDLFEEVRRSSTANPRRGGRWRR
jgi:hypothetical protein